MPLDTKPSLYSEMEALKLEQALQFALLRYGGKKDRCGMPKIFHALYVAQQQVTVPRMIIALFHDLVEDTKTTLDEIEEIGGKHVRDCVALLTHEKGSDRNAYIEMLCTEEDCMWVKKADIEHNTDIKRVDKKAAERFPMYQGEYRKICARLGLKTCCSLTPPEFY